MFRGISFEPLTSRAQRTLLGGVGFASAVMLFVLHARAETRSVAVSSANFRAGPAMDRPIIYTADRYYPVEVLRCDNGWCETQDFEGDRAWVAARLLAEQDAVVVNVDRANVREGPSTHAKVLFRVDWGEALKVTKRQDGWLAIEDLEGERGWVYGKLVWTGAQPPAKPKGAKNEGPKNEGPKNGGPKNEGPKNEGPKKP